MQIVSQSISRGLIPKASKLLHTVPKPDLSNRAFPLHVDYKQKSPELLPGFFYKRGVSPYLFLLPSTSS